MSHQDLQIPVFGRSGNTAQSDWADTDNFDVELLAEYLLDDGVGATNVSFDFKIDNTLVGSGIVSPENSEDGGLPPIGERRMGVNGNNFQVQTMAGAPMGMPPVLSSTSAAASPMPNLQAFASTMNGMSMFPGFQMGAAAPSHPGMIFHQHPAPADENTAKRRRVDQQPQQQQMQHQQIQHVQQQQQMQFQQVQQQQMQHAQQQQMQQVQQQQMQQVQHMLPAAFAQAQALPFLAVAGMNPAALLSGQQLAAAAAAAMQGRGIRKKSQAQIDRRRERNRILARKTRLRKKFFFEALQKEVMDLQKENSLLKDLVKLNLNEEHAKPILDECDAMEKMPPSVLEALGEAAAEMDSKDFNLVRSIQNSQHSFVITDPSLEDNPIVFASDDFCKMTGYKREEVLGRNCRFLQGAETSKEKVKQLRAAVARGEDVTVTFVNYTADGNPFWNKLFIAALRDAQNHIVNFIGVSVKVACPLPGDPEHGKVIVSDDKDDYDDDDGDDD